MKFQVTHIEFDLDDDYGYEWSESKEDFQYELEEKNVGEWESDDENQLLDDITDTTGWCIKNICYDILQPLKCNPIESNQSIMTTVKETDRTFVKAYVQDYADAITENYRLYHIDSMESMLRRDPESVYAAQELNDIQTLSLIHI